MDITKSDLNILRQQVRYLGNWAVRSLDPADHWGQVWDAQSAAIATIDAIEEQLFSKGDKE